jgi:hypothetical protein
MVANVTVKYKFIQLRYILSLLMSLVIKLKSYSYICDQIPFDDRKKFHCEKPLNLIHGHYKIQLQLDLSGKWILE